MNVLVSGVKVHCIVYCFSVDRGPFCWGRVCYMASILWSLELCLFSWVTRYWRNGSCAFCVVFNLLVRYFRMFLCMVFSMFSVWLPRCLTVSRYLITEFSEKFDASFLIFEEAEKCLNFLDSENRDSKWKGEDLEPYSEIITKNDIIWNENCDSTCR